MSLRVTFDDRGIPVGPDNVVAGYRITFEDAFALAGLKTTFDTFIRTDTITLDPVGLQVTFEEPLSEGEEVRPVTGTQVSFDNDPVVTVESVAGTATAVVIEGGPRGPAGPPAPAIRYTHVQSTPAAEWDVPHGLGGYPLPTLFLDEVPEEPVFTDLQYVDDGLLRVLWPSPKTGKAYL